MGSIETGNDRTHELLNLLLNRMDRLEAHVTRSERRAVLASEQNLPIDPNYRNHVLEDNQDKFNRLLPMETDDMIFAFEKCLVDSAIAAADKGTPDRVCFLPV
jgi:hypothetical protein